MVTPQGPEQGNRSAHVPTQLLRSEQPLTLLPAWAAAGAASPAAFPAAAEEPPAQLCAAACALPQAPLVTRHPR
jgi:hypothetical protein